MRLIFNRGEKKKTFIIELNISYWNSLISDMYQTTEQTNKIVKVFQSL